MKKNIFLFAFLWCLSLSAQKCLEGTFENNHFYFKEDCYSVLYFDANHFVVLNKNNQQKAVMHKTGNLKVPFGDYAELERINEKVFLYAQKKKFSKALRYGLVDTTGRFVSKAKYKRIDVYKYNVALAVKKKRYHLVNLQTYQTHQLPKYKAVQALNNSPHWVVVVGLGKVGLIDNDANICIPPIYQEIDGLNFAHFRIKKNEYYGIINPSFQVVCPPKYGLIQNTRNWQLPYFQFSEKGLWGFLDTFGKAILAPTHTAPVRWLSDTLGVYFMNIPNSGQGFINHKLEPLGLPKYASIDAENLQKGYLIVQTDDFFGLVDAKGQEILLPFFDKIVPYENIIHLYKNHKEGRFYPKTQVLIPPVYDYLYKVGENYLEASDVYGGRRRTLYNQLTGKPIIVGKFEDFEIYPNFILAHKMDKIGVFSLSGELLVACAYDFLDYGHLKQNNRVLILGTYTLAPYTVHWWKYTFETNTIEPHTYK